MTELHEGMYISAAFRTNLSWDLYNNVFLPLKVISESKKFYTCEVLPHRNPSGYSFGMSKPYIMTIDKFDLSKGNIKIEKFNKEAYIKHIVWGE